MKTRPNLEIHLVIHWYEGIRGEVHTRAELALGFECKPNLS